MSSNPQMYQTIFISVSFVGFHRWKDAPDHLGYLRYPHRHIFDVKIEATVTHNDRAIEFHDFKKYMRGVVGLVEQQMKLFDPVDACSTMSCEQIGEAVMQLGDKYPITKVTVTEDNECGAITCRY